MSLKTAIHRNLENYLQDWDKESSWSRQCDDLADQLVATVHDAASIPDDAICFFRDGDKWLCVYGNFINLQESPSGFGDSFDEAMESLKRNIVPS